MKSVALWTLGGLLAFLATAGAFLFLANLGGGATASDPIPRAEPSETPQPGPALVLGLPEERLEALQRRPGQRLALDVGNEGDESIPSVELALDVVSENTARPRHRSYEQAVEQLAPGETAVVEFEIDLSPSPPDGMPEPTQQPREILEVRASTSKGASSVKTAVLAP